MTFVLRNSFSKIYKNASILSENANNWPRKSTSLQCPINQLLVTRCLTSHLLSHATIKSKAKVEVIKSIYPLELWRLNWLRIKFRRLKLKITLVCWLMDEKGHFRILLCLCFKTSLCAPVIWKWVLHRVSFSCISKSFPWEWFRTWTCFEAEAQGNSETAYWEQIQCTLQTEWINSYLAPKNPQQLLCSTANCSQ